MERLPLKKINLDKFFYKIGEVSDIAKVEPYVLRYWESEFSFLKPQKNKAGQRVYTKKNIELVLQIRNLLYKDKYTIAGVKRKFNEDSLKKNSVPIETVERVKKRLKEILKTLK